MAIYASSYNFCDDSCFHNLGPTHHVTIDPSNLGVMNKFHCSQYLQVGNLEEFHIANVGMNSFSSKTSDKTFFLENLLYVPQIAKNLLSVSQFT